MSRLPLKPGRIVLVTPYPVQQEEPFLARIVGTDVFHSKYQVGARYYGWNESHFARGGSWAFPDQVETVDDGDVPFVAAFCDYDGMLIMLFPPGVKGTRPGWQHVESYHWLDDDDPRTARGRRMYRRHKVRPAPGTAETADVWDVDVATARGYLKPAQIPAPKDSLPMKES